MPRKPREAKPRVTLDAAFDSLLKHLVEQKQSPKVSRWAARLRERGEFASSDRVKARGADCAATTPQKGD